MKISQTFYMGKMQVEVTKEIGTPSSLDRFTVKIVNENHVIEESVYAETFDNFVTGLLQIRDIEPPKVELKARSVDNLEEDQYDD